MLCINARFLTQPITGVQRYAYEITTKFSCQYDDVCLLLPNRLIDRYLPDLQTVITRTSLTGHSWEQIVLPRYIKRYKGNVLFSPCNTGPLEITNQVVTIHDAAIFARPEGFSPNFVRWYRFLLPRLAQQVAHIITVSEFSKQELLKYFKVPPSKISVIYNGVDRRFSPQPIDMLAQFINKKKLPERYVFTLGSRAKNKNFLGLLKAWEMLVNDGNLQDVWLVIAGGIAKALQADELSNMVNSLPRVIDLGYVTDEELPLLYSGAELFVFPSFYEGFGLPPLEAMACGTPVVISNTASLPEVVGDAGITVNPYDVEDIARGMYMVLTKSDYRNNLSIKSLHQAGSFNWEESAKQTIDILNHACE